MIDRALLQTAAESATEAAGSSLARSLPKIPVTIGLSGALGSGKTAFMRGFLRECGIREGVTSPTYALEQRYPSPRGEVLHIDLYRLDQAEASKLLATSEHHPGIRCIEWPEKAGNVRTDIRVFIEETSNGNRSIEIVCKDVVWPDDETIDAWRSDVRLPENIAAHCDAVADFCVKAADMLIARGVFVRRNFVRAAGRVHDLLRFVNFHAAAAPKGYSEPAEDKAIWEQWKQRYGVPSHEEAVALFLREQGYPELGMTVSTHGVTLPPSARVITEQHVLYYADKRHIGDQFVTIAERYADFGDRYGKGVRSPESLRWEAEAMDAERLLFPDGAPF